VLAAALLLNVVVLVPVVGSLLAGAGWADVAYGARSPARDILLSVYVAILTASVALLASTAAGRDARQAVTGLLCVQVVYKLVSAWTVRDLRNPVVVSNLLIACFHAAAVTATAQSWDWTPARS
jgi:hypothetical protein